MLARCWANGATSWRWDERPYKLAVQRASGETSGTTSGADYQQYGQLITELGKLKSSLFQIYYYDTFDTFARPPLSINLQLN